VTGQVELTPTAEDDLRRLDSAVARRMIAKLQWLAENVDTIRHETLTGTWKGVFKLRVGDYRVLYTREATKRRIVVHFVRHRREVYNMGEGDG
jgi:mRNA interferase RelE/StbE